MDPLRPDGLSPQARLMAEFVACLEDSDRRSDVIEADLGRPVAAARIPDAEPMPETRQPRVRCLSDWRPLP